MIKRLVNKTRVPIELLQLADPSIDHIEKYLEKSDVFICRHNFEIVGVIVFYKIDEDTLEIKNIAVDVRYQNRGIGKELLDFAILYAKLNNFKQIEIGTGNSSNGQLYLYKKCGFVENKVIKNYFIDNYPEPIYENGVQCVDMIVLKYEV